MSNRPAVGVDLVVVASCIRLVAEEVDFLPVRVSKGGREEGERGRTLKFSDATCFSAYVLSHPLGLHNSK